MDFTAFFKLFYKKPYPNISIISIKLANIQETVTGHTPPGTGVIAKTSSFTSLKSISPLAFPFIFHQPTSIKVCPH